MHKWSGKEERLRSDYPTKSKGKIDVPAQKGDYGIPAGMPSMGNSGPKVDVPSTKGDKGASLSGPAPSRPAPLD